MGTHSSMCNGLSFYSPSLIAPWPQWSGLLRRGKRVPQFRRGYFIHQVSFCFFAFLFFPQSCFCGAVFASSRLQAREQRRDQRSGQHRRTLGRGKWLIGSSAQTPRDVCQIGYEVILRDVREEFSLLAVWVRHWINRSEDSCVRLLALLA